jgi:methylase of polypeptide subunit release factors
MPRLAMRIYAAVAGMVRRNHFLFRRLFGFGTPPEMRGQLWDWTTILLRRALGEQLRPGGAFLDMGTGPVAVLGIHARQTLRPGRVCAVDHVPAVLECARRTATLARVDIETVQSSLFSEVRGKFDIIAFNAPYIDETSGARLSLLDSKLAYQRWCGGAGGMETISHFLATAHEFLTPGGQILLGVNRFYVSDAAVRESAQRTGCLVERTWMNRATRAAVYLLRPAPSTASNLASRA